MSDKVVDPWDVLVDYTNGAGEHECHALEPEDGKFPNVGLLPTDRTYPNGEVVISTVIAPGGVGGNFI